MIIGDLILLIVSIAVFTPFIIFLLCCSLSMVNETLVEIVEAWKNSSTRNNTINKQQ